MANAVFQMPQPAENDVVRTGPSPSLIVRFWRYGKRLSVTNLYLAGSQDAQVSTTIFPPALFSSMQRCASTISSSRKVLPI